MRRFLAALLVLLLIGAAAFWFLAALVGFPAPLIYFINVERGKVEGEKLAETIEGFETEDHAREDGEEEDEAARGMLADYEATDSNEHTAHRR